MDISTSIVNCIGLMSGTSCDGLDIAYCSFTLNEKNEAIKYEIKKAETIKYPKEIESTLHNAENLPLLDFLLFDRNYGNFIGKEVKSFVERHSIKDVQFIASHGHTIFHQPQKGLTVQIGNVSNIAASSGLTVIGDFRSVDVALKGQGAPLVPIGDKLLFKQYKFCLNLGGIANISYDDENGKRIAFDICPMNMVLNYLSNKKGKEFDEDGKIAKEGKILENILGRIRKLDYFNQNGAKSLGKEWIFEKYIPELLKEENKIEDLMATTLEFSALMIAETVKNNVLKGEKDKDVKMLVTGGGALNKYFIEKLREKLNGICEVVLPEENIVNFKEALIFAFLGLLRKNKKVNCLKSATGALRDSIGGIIVLGDSEF